VTALPAPRSPSGEAPTVRRYRRPRRAPLARLRVLVYAPGATEGLHGLWLARQVAWSWPGAGIAVATDGIAAGPRQPAGVRWNRLPELSEVNPERPLSLEHTRSARRRLLNNLFDRLRPGVLIVCDGEAPLDEVHELLDRATAYGRTRIVGRTLRHGPRVPEGPQDCEACGVALAAIAED
jgi:hypothetical protein